jgi:hypothetical protein
MMIPYAAISLNYTRHFLDLFNKKRNPQWISTNGYYHFCFLPIYWKEYENLYENFSFYDEQKFIVLALYYFGLLTAMYWLKE